MNLVTRSFLLRTLKFIGFWVLIGLTIWIIGHFIHLFIPFILAFIMVAMISPIKRYLIRKFRFPKELAVISAMIIGIGGLSILVFILISVIINEFQDIYHNWPYYNTLFLNTFSNGLAKAETLYLNLPAEYITMIKDTVAKLMNSIPQLLSHGLSFAVTIPEAIIVIVIAIVATYFMSIGSQRYLLDFLKIFPSEWRESLKELGHDFLKALSGFIKAELIIFGISMFVCITALLLFKAKYAIVLGTLTGIFGILPALGVGIILIPWSIISAFAGNTVLAVELLILTIFVSVLRHTIEPKILGDNVGLDPLFVLVSMYIGLAATGVIGLFLGPFVLIAYKALQKAGVFRNL